jgi:hypothetical protein
MNQEEIHYLQIIAERLKEHNPELFRVCYEITNSIDSVYDYILDSKTEILNEEIARVFKTNEFIFLFRDDYEIMIKLIKFYCTNKNLSNIKKYCKEFLDKNNTHHQKFMLYLAIYIEPSYFSEFTIETKDDENIIYLATKQNNQALLFASERLKSNKNFISKMLDDNINCFEFTNKNIKTDKKLSIKAIKLDKLNIKFVSNVLFEDIEFIKYAYSLGCQNIYEKIHIDIAHKEEIIKKAIENDDNIDLIFMQNVNIRSDREIVNLALEKSSNPNILRYLSQELKFDGNICKKAIMKNINAIKYLPEDLKNNKNYMADIICSINFGFHQKITDILGEKYKFYKCDSCEENKGFCEKCKNILNLIYNECQNNPIVIHIKENLDFSYEI